MRVIYAYTRVYAEAVSALDAEEYPYEMVDVSSDDESYWRLRRDLWHAGEDHLIVEHDMIIPHGSIAQFEACPEEWCGHLYYSVWGGWGVWWGVTRYRGSLTRRHPDLPESIESRHWGSLDSAWINHLRLLCYPEAHRHEPPAIHLTKGRGGLGVTVFVNCSGCGSALPTEEVERSPQPRCQDCGLVNDAVVEPTTMTVPIL
jgi:hypothetical protein